MAQELAALSAELARVTAQAGEAVVAVHARARFSSSGVLWRPGVIVTAEHTVRREEDIAVTLPNGKTVAARLAGSDAGTDIAVLQVDADARPPAPASDVTAGELALTIGRSQDSGVNATMGIVSAVSGSWRTWRGGRLDRYIRLDLTLYPGSSGGLVVNVAGEARRARIAAPVDTRAGVKRPPLRVALPSTAKDGDLCPTRARGIVLGMRPRLSRRSFLAAAAAAPLSTVLAQGSRIPIGLELYSVRGELAKDLKGTVTAVAKMGYRVVEFFSPYYQWTTDYATEVRKLMDDLGIRCNSTHNDARNLSTGLPKAIELNRIIGAKFIVMASAPPAAGVEGWKNVAAILTAAAAQTRADGLRVGYHNHQAEFTPLPDGGPMPIQVLADNTPKEVMLQFDVGTAVQMGYDPVKWIDDHPGRINSVHCKDYGAPKEGDRERGYRVLFGEGDVPWTKVLPAAAAVGGAEYFLIEQEGSRFPEIDTAQKCLDNYRKMFG